VNQITSKLIFKVSQCTKVQYRFYKDEVKKKKKTHTREIDVYKCIYKCRYI